MNFLKSLIIGIISLVAGGAIFFGIAQYMGYISVFTVSGPSMEPTLKNFQGVIVVNREKPQSGDLVFFQKPESWIKGDDQDRVLVKRIVAVYGDKFEYIDGKFFVNGKQVFDTKSTNYDCSKGKNNYKKILEGDQLIAFGDNANNSFDSRRIFCDGDTNDAFIPTDKIVSFGTVLFTF